MAVDRYDKYIKGKEAGILELIKQGAVDSELAAYCGCSAHTFTNIKHDSERLRTMLSDGRRKQCIEVRNALLKRALGLSIDSTIEEAWEENGKVKKHKRKVHKEFAPDPSAARLYLALYQPGFSDAGEYQDELKRIDALCKVRQTEHTTNRTVESEVLDDDDE